MIFRNFLFILFLIISNQLSAQNFQLAGIGYSNYAKTAITDSPVNQAIEFQELSFFAKLPIKLKNPKTVLLNNFRYGLVQATTYNSPLFLNVKNQKNLHSLSLSMIVKHNLGNHWAIIGGFTPTLAADLEEKLSGDDFLFQGFLLASKKQNDQWSWGGGLIYTTQFGDPRFLPALQLRYLHNQHFINVLLPSFVNYLYKFKKQEKLRIGFRLATNGGNFNVNNQDFTQVIPNTINKILVSRANMGAVINYQLTKSILFELCGGISAARKYKLVNVNNVTYKYNSEKGGFFNIGLILTPPFKDTENSNID
jgi:hypothetical protein